MTRRRLIAGAVGIGALVLLFAWTRMDRAASAGDTRRLTLTGSSTVAPLAAELGRRFEARHRGVRIDVQTGGSSRGLADARRGLADVGMVSRALGAAEADLRGAIIARDGICLIVHRDNPLTGLTAPQVVAIYSGRARSWAAVGGPDRPITVVHKAAGRSTHELFLAHFGLRASAVRADVVIGDNRQGIKTVAGAPDALGYVSIGAAAHDAEAGVPIKLLALDGVQPTTAAITSGAFPLVRPLTLVTRAVPTGLAAEFIRFARSADVHDLVRRQGFVPVSK